MPNLIEFVFRSDSRSAMRAFTEIADASQRTSRTIKKDAAENSASMHRVEKSSVALRESMHGLVGMVGLGGLAFGLKDAVQGGMRLQGAQTQLQQALKTTGHAAGGTLKTLNDYAEKLSTHGGFETTQNVQALTAFTRETHSATKATSLLSLATNIARGRGTDLASAQSVVARAYTGQVGRLQQLLGPMVAVKNAQFGLTQEHKAQVTALEAQSKIYGKLGPAWVKQQELIDGITPQMHALAVLQDKSATAQQVLGAAQTVFAGATGSYAGTTQGKISNLQNSLKNLTDTTGQKLLPAVNLLARDATGVVNVFSKLPTSVQAGALGLTALGLIAGPLHNSFRLLKDMIDGTKTIMGLFKGATEAATVAERVQAGAAGATATETAAVGAETAAAGSGVTAASLGLAGLGSIGLGAAGIGALGGFAYMTATGQDHLNPKSPSASFGRRGIGGQSLNSYAHPTVAPQMANSGDIHIHNHLVIDGRVFTKAIADTVIRKAARGPSSLVGGSLQAAAPR